MSVMEQQTTTATKPTAKPNTVLLQHKSREGDRLVFRPTPGGGKIKGLAIISPGSGDNVTSPFPVCGSFDFVGDLPQVWAVSDADGSTHQPVRQITPPPQGCDWAFEFNLDSGDYTIKDMEGSTLYSVDPVHVQ
jgi:hypothetical protein